MNAVRLSCEEVDELGAAFALGALDRSEQAATAQHVASCERGHPELQELLSTASLLPAALDPVEPSPGTRARLLASIASVPQEHAQRRPARPPRVAVDGETARRSWLGGWLAPRLVPAMVAAGLAGLVALGAWNLQLRGALDDREAVLAEVAQTLAASTAAYPVDGTAGTGYLVQGEDATASLIVTDLQDLSAGERYQMWLIADDELVTAGSFTATADDLLVVTLDRPIGDYDTFAISVETRPVEEPSGDPVMVAALGA